MAKENKTLRQAQGKIIKVDKNLCIGCGACAALCPEVFELGSDGKAKVKNPEGCDKCDCEAARESCPVSAISLE